jgi:hypothetical protein
MLTRRDVGIGKCYVNEKEHIAREVVDVIDHRIVKYNTYNLKTGKLLLQPHQTCPKSQMIRWADREATDIECSKLQLNEAKEIFSSKANEIQPDRITGEIVKSQSLTEIRHLTPNG